MKKSNRKKKAKPSDDDVLLISHSSHGRIATFFCERCGYPHSVTVIEPGEVIKTRPNYTPVSGHHIYWYWNGSTTKPTISSERRIKGEYSGSTSYEMASCIVHNRSGVLDPKSKIYDCHVFVDEGDLINYYNVEIWRKPLLKVKDWPLRKPNEKSE